MKKKNLSKVGKKLPKLESVGYPRPLYSDVENSLYDIPGYRSLGRKGRTILPLEGKELMPMPSDALLYLLPQRQPMLWKKGEVEILPLPLTAVGAVLPKGYLVTANPACAESETLKEALPQMPYGAISCWQNQNWVSAVKVVPSYLDADEVSVIGMLSPTQALAEFSVTELPQPFPKKWILDFVYCPGVSDTLGELAAWSIFLKTNPPIQIRLSSFEGDFKKLIALLEGLDFPMESQGLDSVMLMLEESAPDAVKDQVVYYWQQ